MSDPTAPATNAELLQRRAELDGERTFLRVGAGTWTYGESRTLVARLAGGLSAAGIGVGDRVLLMLPNSPEFIWASLALAWIGAVEVPLNTALKGEVLRHQIADADARLAIVHVGLLDRFLPAAEGLLDHDRIVPADGADDGSGASFAALAAHAEVDLVDSDEATLAAIIYTSGTTGRAKGVEVTHGHAGRFAADWIDAVGFDRDDVLMTPLPLFHSIARTLGVLPTLMLGATISVVERFSASRFWDQVRACDATVIHGIFGMVPILLNQPPRDDDRDHRVRRFYIGPSALSPAFEARFGIEVVEVYGATETGIVTMIGAGQQHRPGSCGLANDRTYEVTLLDEFDRTVADGEVGEIAVRPRVPFSLLTGYHGRPLDTLAAFRNLWFHTGDYGRRDHDGYYYFVDRKKDAIRRRGENITSAEVETEVNAHPSVLETAVVAVPSELGEDEVMACVVLRPGAALDPRELITFLDARLPYFMVPRYVELLAELPKTANGKIQKNLLRERGTRGLTAHTWDREAHGIELTR